MKPLVSKKVLVVDDSPIVRERLVSLLLEVPGVEIAGQADRAAQAIEAIKTLRPSVVVLDISMPGGSGLVVLQALQDIKPSPLIIVLTNFSHEAYRTKCLQLGADYFFDKSTEFEEVKYILERLPQPVEVA